MDDKGTGDKAGKIKNRYYPRLETEILLSYAPLSEQEQEALVVKSRTFGLGGLMFESDHPLKEGSEFVLSLVLGESRLEVKGKVVYSKCMGPERYENGFTYVKLTEEQRNTLTHYFLQEYEKRPRDLK